MALKVTNGLDLLNQRIINVGSPAQPADAVPKQYVDDNLAGLRWKQPVRAGTTTNGALASAFANGSTIDGVTLATGDRILVKDQSTQTENGIYVVAASGAPARAGDADTGPELHAATVLVTSGTVNADKAFTQTTDNPTLGTSAIVFAQFGGGSSYSFGDGLVNTSGTVNLVLDGASLQKSPSGLRIGAAAAGAGLVESAGVLAVNAGTGVQVVGDAVQIDTSVVSRKVSGNIGNGSLTAITFTHNLGTYDVQVEVYDATTRDTVLCDVGRPTTNGVTLSFAVAPATNAYRVVVTG